MTDMDRLIDESRAWRIALVAGCAVLITRKADGRDVLLQFLIEAVILSSLGGVIGILIGVGASELVSMKTGWPILVSSTSVVVAVVFSAAVGMFFGFYPARKAAQLDPIEALRYE